MISLRIIEIHMVSLRWRIIYFPATGDAARYKCSSSLSVCVFEYAMCVAIIADGQHGGRGLA